MSNEAITWSLRVRVPPGNSSAKGVLFVLANQANGDPSRGVPMLSHPSIAYLVDTTGQNRKTIITNLQKLQEWGLITDTGRRTGRTGQVVVYELHTGPDLFTAIDVKQSRNRNSSEIGTVPKSEQFQKPPVTVPISASNSPEIGTRNQEQPKATVEQKRAPALARPDGVQEQTWADWQALRKAKRAPITETVLNHAHAEAAKAGLPLERFLQIWCARGSQGLQADWLTADERTTTTPVSRGTSNAAHRPGYRESAAERVRRLAIEGEQRDRDAAAASPHVVGAPS